jgi:hypothetical protein
VPRESTNDRKLRSVDRRVADARQRLEERDRRLASDSRTDAERWLGDPPPAQSALRQRAAHLAQIFSKRTPDDLVDQLIDVLRRRSTRSAR